MLMRMTNLCYLTRTVDLCPHQELKVVYFAPLIPTMNPAKSTDIKLPWEIIFLIIERLTDKYKDAILPPSHSLTKTLLALTRVCRATYPTASRLLWRHCVYLDSSQRSREFWLSLSSPSPFDRPWLAQEPSRLFFCPFPDTVSGLSSPTSAALPTLEEPPWHSQDFSSPNDDSDADSASPRPYRRFSPLNDVPTARLVENILCHLAPVLKKLVIDMPLRTLWPEDDAKGVRRMIRRGFEALENLEEFVSIRDELFLDIKEERPSRETLVWDSHWPKLRHLALYNLDLDSIESMWDSLARVPHLETAIFTRPDLLEDSDIKQLWADATLEGSTDTPRIIQRGFRCVFVNCAGWLPDFTSYEEGWRQLDPNNLLKV